jgi:NAD(P)H-hydrate epimerase
VVERVLRAFAGPVVLDADALSAFGSDVNAMATLLGGRPAILTPHMAEFGRLTGTSVDETERRRFEVSLPLAKHVRAVVLLKGQPTVLTSPTGERLVSASGTPLLAAAGSGDLLAGMVGTLLAQTGDPFVSAAIAAWVHGRAAWLVQRGQRTLRGYTLSDVTAKLPAAWSVRATPTRSPILVELPDVVPARA